MLMIMILMMPSEIFINCINYHWWKRKSVLRIRLPQVNSSDFGPFEMGFIGIRLSLTWITGSLAGLGSNDPDQPVWPLILTPRQPRLPSLKIGPPRSDSLGHAKAKLFDYIIMYMPGHKKADEYEERACIGPYDISIFSLMMFFH